MSTLTTIIQHSFGSLSHSNQRRKRNKNNPNRKRRSKIVIFAEDMIIYIENPKDVTRKLLELINEFGKVAGYKINAQKSLAFVYKICMETQKTPNSQSKLEKGKRSWRNQAPGLQTILESYGNQDSMVLAQNQKYRSMEQDRKPRDKPTHIWSPYF